MMKPNITHYAPEQPADTPTCPRCGKPCDDGGVMTCHVCYNQLTDQPDLKPYAQELPAATQELVSELVQQPADTHDSAVYIPERDGASVCAPAVYITPAPSALDALLGKIDRYVDIYGGKPMANFFTVSDMLSVSAAVIRAARDEQPATVNGSPQLYCDGYNTGTKEHRRDTLAAMERAAGGNTCKSE